MTLTTENRWAAAGAIASSAMLLYIPLAYDYSVLDLLMSKKGQSEDYQTTHRLAGIFVHAVVLFFVTFGILCADFACA